MSFSSRIRLVLALIVALAGAGTAQAEVSRALFQVRLQVLSVCQVGVSPDAAGSDEGWMLAIKCSRNTPFAVARSTQPDPLLAGTGTGVAAAWPMRDLLMASRVRSDGMTAAGTRLRVDY